MRIKIIQNRSKLSVYNNFMKIRIVRTIVEEFKTLVPLGGVADPEKHHRIIRNVR